MSKINPEGFKERRQVLAGLLLFWICFFTLIAGVLHHLNP